MPARRPDSWAPPWMKVSRGAPADVQRAHAAGPVELVSGQGQHVDVLGVHVDRQVAHGLDGVHMEGDALFPAKRPDLSDGLDGANLVVGEHDGHQGGVRPDGGGHVGYLYNAALAHRQQGDLEAVLF